MNVYQIAKQLMQEQTSLTEAFNGAYKELPPHIKQALAQSNFAKNLSAHGIDHNSKPVFTKVNSELELNKQLRQLQKEHGNFAGFAIEILSPEYNSSFAKPGKDDWSTTFEPGPVNPIFIFALRNGYEQASLATKGNINKYSEHASNLYRSRTLGTYTISKDVVKRSTHWLDEPYDKIEALLSRSKGANLYAFVGSGQSIARQRADNMDFVDKYAPTSGRGPTPFMISAQDGEMRKKYRADKNERELQRIAANSTEVVIRSVSTLSDLKAIYDAANNKATSLIKIGNVWLYPQFGTFSDSIRDRGISRLRDGLLKGLEVEVAIFEYSKEPVDVTNQDVYDFKHGMIFAKLQGDKIVLRMNT